MKKPQQYWKGIKGFGTNMTDMSSSEWNFYDFRVIDFLSVHFENLLLANVTYIWNRLKRSEQLWREPYTDFPTKFGQNQASSFGEYVPWRSYWCHTGDYTWNTKDTQRSQYCWLSVAVYWQIIYKRRLYEVKQKADFIPFKWWK